MIIIACVDENMGMLFGGRRQSRDKAVIEEIYALVGENRLYIHSFSAPLFDKEKVGISADMLEKAEEGDYCFVENLHLSPYADKIEEIILFHWNTGYPCDFYLDIPLESYKKTETREFPGNSHKKITKAVYKKCEK